MSEEFKLEVVNPEKSFLSKEDVTEVVVPAFEGEMGILKDHISIISFLPEVKPPIAPPKALPSVDVIISTLPTTPQCSCVPRPVFPRNPVE